MSRDLCYDRKQDMGIANLKDLACVIEEEEFLQRSLPSTGSNWDPLFRQESLEW